VIEGLGPLATLSVLEHADHSFHDPVRFGKTDAQVMVEMLDVMAGVGVAGRIDPLAGALQCSVPEPIREAPHDRYLYQIRP
jgi:hypothetical protein